MSASGNFASIRCSPPSNRNYKRVAVARRAVASLDAEPFVESGRGIWRIALQARAYRPYQLRQPGLQRLRSLLPLLGLCGLGLCRIKLARQARARCRF
jgi:hypothetical protein